MASDFTIKRGDTLPALAAQLRDNGVPIDLTTATTVKFIMKPQGGGTPTVNAAMTFVSRPEGQVAYSWVAGDTSTIGIYDVEFQITWTGGGIETVPNDIPAGHSSPYYTLEVKQDLAD